MPDLRFVSRFQSTAEQAFAVFVLWFASTGALVPLLRGAQEVTVATQTDTALEADPVTLPMWIGVYALTLLLIIPRWKQFALVATRNKLLLLLVGLALVSMLWSVAPEVTFRRGVALVGTTLFGGYFAVRYSLREQIRLLAWALGIAALLSLLIGLALPSYGTAIDVFGQTAWRGIYSTKNVLGSNMVLGALVFLILAVSGRRWRWVAWTGCGLSLGLLLLSTSRTALIVFLTLLALWPLYKALRWHYTLAVPFLIVAVLLVGALSMLVSATWEPLLEALGRDATLTGRTVLWSLVWDMIRERPWLGYGYAGFWLGWEGPSAYIWRITRDSVPQTDNGYLDLWLDLGLLGVSLFALQFLQAFGRALAWVRWTKATEDLWPPMFLAFILLLDLTESAILKQNSLAYILYVAVVFSVSMRRGLPTLPRYIGEPQTKRPRQ